MSTGRGSRSERTHFGLRSVRRFAARDRWGRYSGGPTCLPQVLLRADTTTWTGSECAQEQVRGLRRYSPGVPERGVRGGPDPERVMAGSETQAKIAASQALKWTAPRVRGRT